MFIKITLIRELEGVEVKYPTLKNLDDVKEFKIERLREGSIYVEKVVVYYKSYSDTDEEFDVIDESVEELVRRMIASGQYNPPPKVEPQNGEGKSQVKLTPIK